MDNNRKSKLAQQTRYRYFFLRFKLGCKAVISDRHKLYFLIGYIGILLILWHFRATLFGLGTGGFLEELRRIGVETLFRAFSIAGFVGLIMLFGMPFGSKSIHENLQRIGFTNSAGETPLLIASRADKDHPNVTVLEFEANGIPLLEWENKHSKLEAALNVHATQIKEGKNKRRILMYVVAAGKDLTKALYWDAKYLSAVSDYS